MKIGFDISQTGNSKAGCGFFAESLIHHLAQIDHRNEYVLYPTFGDFFFDPHNAHYQIKQNNMQYGLRHSSLHQAHAFWNSPPTNYETMLGNPDVIHANNFYCPSQLKNARLIFTLYDLGFIENPKWTTEENRCGCFNGVFNASLYADFIVTISEHSRRHFLKVFPHYPPERISVVYPASRFSSSRLVSKPETLHALQTDRFWLCVGTIEPRKNHIRLLRTFAKLKKHSERSFPLVLVGRNGWLMEGFQKEIEELGLDRDVILLGYEEDVALQWLYQNCFAFLYPSLFEGFGLPVLEAMCLGAPVITSNTSSIPEITGSAALLVDPLQEEDIFQTMLKLSLEQDFRKNLKESALQQSKCFSWDRSATKMLELYQAVLHMPKLSSSVTG